MKKKDIKPQIPIGVSYEKYSQAIMLHVTAYMAGTAGTRTGLVASFGKKRN